MNRDLPALIRELKGTRTYEELATDCGGVPSKNRLYTMVRQPLNQFPTTDSIHGLSNGLGVSPNTIVDACSVSLGFADPNAGSTALLLPDTARYLTDSQRSLVVGMVNEFVATNRRAQYLEKTANEQ